MEALCKRGGLQMLLEFSCSNHKSIKNKILFSFIATDNDTLKESLKTFSNFKVLRSAVIYGANGSGKSNFLDTLQFMVYLVSKSITFQPGQAIPQFPHKLNPDTTPSEYNIQFVKDDIRFAYGFSLVKNKVVDEYLYFFPKGRKVKIFERTNMEIIPGDRYKSAFKLSLKSLKENRLFLSCAANYSDAYDVEAAFHFFIGIVTYHFYGNDWMPYSVKLLKENEKVKQTFVETLQALGIKIRDIRVNIENVKNTPTQIVLNLFKPVETSIQPYKFEVKMIYEKFETDLISEESTGVKKLFEILCPIIDIINNEKILICDEFEMGLHESIVYEIVKLFQSARKDKFAQLIFSTHNTNLLNSNLFRRDQIWFTQLDEEHSTDLYSLIEIKHIKKTENFEKGYILGKYGAIPMLNKNFSFDKLFG